MRNHIEVNARTRGGKPCIAGTRITVQDVVLMHLRLGQSLEEIAGNFDLPPASVHAAMAYYYDHKDAIDKSLEDDAVFTEAFRKSNPSLLREKLKALTRG